MSKTSILMHSNATKTSQDNIAAKNTWGTKKRETLFVNSVVGGGGATGGGASYITSHTRSTNNVQGNVVSTGINSDLAIQGQGMLVVSDSTNGEKVFTRRGDFRQDELGYWKNGADQLLYANKLDKDGNPAKDASLLSSLTAVNFANVKGDPKATSTISIAMNFNSAQEALRGAGITAAVKKTGINASANSSKEDILFTENLPNSGSFNLGDRFTFTSTPPGLAKTIEYGGLAIAVAPNGTNPIFAAQKVGDKFSIGVGPNQAPEGATLRIVLSNGTNYTFTLSANAQAANKTFNSIQTLSDAINKVGGLNAKIDLRNNNLYIASVDPDLGMTFQDGNGGTFVDKLGLTDVPTLAAAQALPGGAVLSQRFNNLQTLNAAVNDKPDDFSLKATVENGNIKITSLLATDKFKIEGQSLGVRLFNKAQLGDGTEENRAAIEIKAPQHGLQTGDLIQLSAAINGQAPAGIYSIARVDNDRFRIFLISSDAGAAAGAGIANGLPASNAVAPAANQLVVPAGTTWQKIPGQKFQSVNAALNVANPGAGGVAAGGAGVDNLARIGINSLANGLLVGDVVLITGGGAFNVGAGAGYDVNLPDGYYIVKVANPGDFQIEPLQVAASGTILAAAGKVNANITYRRVGKTDNANGVTFTTPAGITTFDTKRLFTTAIGVVAGKNKVTICMPSNNYNVGDMIRFNGLPDPYVIDGITVRNNENYKVLTTDTVNGYITFETPIADGVAGAGNCNGTYTTVANTATTMNLGPDFRVDNVSRLLEYFSISEDAGKELDEVYNADNVEKSLAGNEELKSTESFTYPLSLFDSLGEKFNLRLKFAKLGKNEWAVEIAAEEDSVTGQFDISEARDDGQIKSGRIRFDDKGQFLSAGSLEGPLTVTRKNGSASSQITIDWRNELAKVKSGTVTQYESPSPFNVELIQQDGQAAGNLVNLEVSQEGFIIGTFDSGQTIKLYQIPVALFANVNGLRAGIGGTFAITRESGESLLKNAMSGGAGKVLGGALEAANVDTTEELLELQDLSNDIRANARAANVTNKNIQTILSEIQ